MSTAATGKRIVSVMTASSKSGLSCVKHLLKRSHTSGGTPIETRAVFRTDERRRETVDALAQDATQTPALTTLAGADADDPSTLPAAFDGANCAVIVTPHDPARGIADDARLTSAMIAAAAQAPSVEHVVVVGSWTAPHADGRLPILGARFEPVERDLGAAARAGPGGRRVPFTVLRGGYFAQNFALTMAPAIREGRPVEAPRLILPAVDARDIGECAAAVCAAEDLSAHDGRFYEISGPERLDTEQVVAAIGRGIGKELEYREIPVEDAARPAPPFMAQLLRVMASDPDIIPFPGDVENLIGHPGNTVEAWAREHRALFE